MEKDLVCGVELDENKKIPLSYLYRGRIYHFCSEACQGKFSKSPREYVK